MPTHPKTFVQAIDAAINSVFGWAVVVVVTMLVGLWVGTSIGRGGIASLDDVGNIFVASWIVAIFFPPFMLSLVVMAAVWYLPMRFESIRLRIAMSALNLTSWTVASALLASVFH